MTGGRPLRFLALMLCLWVGARGFAIYREGSIGQAVSRIAPVARAVASFVATPAAAAPAPRWDVASVPVRASTLRQPDHRFERVGAGAGSVLPSAGAGTPPVPLLQTRIVAPLPPQPVLGPALRPPPIAGGPSRLAGSAWMIARGGMTSSVTGSQLGGSQAGARLTYALGAGRRVALAARVSAPLAGVGREAAIGIDWQPTRAPVHILAEQRIAIDGGRGGTMVGVIGGFGPQPIAPGVTLEGYGQAGIIARDSGEAFADGALRAAHPLVRLGGLGLDIGAGAWGGAQRGASRLDIGPSLGVVVPIGRRRLRLTADWRERIAGAARPGSGPALSLGTDF